MNSLIGEGGGRKIFESENSVQVKLVKFCLIVKTQKLGKIINKREKVSKKSCRRR